MITVELTLAIFHYIYPSWSKGYGVTLKTRRGVKTQKANIHDCFQAVFYFCTEDKVS